MDPMDPKPGAANERNLIDARLATLDTVIANMRAALDPHAMDRPGESIVGPFERIHEDVVAVFLAMGSRWFEPLRVRIVDHYGNPNSRKNVLCLWAGKRQGAAD